MFGVPKYKYKLDQGIRFKSLIPVSGVIYYASQLPFSSFIPPLSWFTNLVVKSWFFLLSASDVPFKITQAWFLVISRGAYTTAETWGSWKFCKGRILKFSFLTLQLGMLLFLIWIFIWCTLQRVQTLIEEQQSQTPERVDWSKWIQIQLEL